MQELGWSHSLQMQAPLAPMSKQRPRACSQSSVPLKFKELVFCFQMMCWIHSMGTWVGSRGQSPCGERAHWTSPHSTPISQLLPNLQSALTGTGGVLKQESGCSHSPQMQALEAPGQSRPQDPRHKPRDPLWLRSQHYKRTQDPRHINRLQLQGRHIRISLTILVPF